jgi:hypothetical protein
MAKNRNTLKARIRRGSGNPKIEVVTDVDLDSYIDEGIDEISRHAPAWAIAYLTTVADQISYAAASGVYEVCFCYYVRGLLASELFGEGFESLSVITEGLSYDVEMNQYNSFVYAMQTHHILSFYDWEWNSFDKKLYLIPPPAAAGDKVYYIGLKKWTFDTIPDRFEKYLHMYGVARTLEQYGRTQRRETAVSHLGTKEPWTMAEEMLLDSRRVKADFDEYMLVEGKKMAVFLGD